jgi:hypothetical protein
METSTLQHIQHIATGAALLGLAACAIILWSLFDDKDHDGY